MSTPQRRYLVLGTDTDVGKTFVCAALCAALLKTGSRVTVCKPVETGGQSDLDAIAHLCKRSERLRVRKGLRYALAGAPTAAAKAENRPAPSALDVAAIVRSSEEQADAVIVETCGGALTPLSHADVVADLVARLPEYRPVIVAGLRLGVLSHTFGAVEYLRSRGAREPLVVLNDRYASSPFWYVESTRGDLRLRGLDAVAFVGYRQSIEDVDFSQLLRTA